VARAKITKAAKTSQKANPVRKEIKPYLAIIPIAPRTMATHHAVYFWHLISFDFFSL